MKVKFARVKPGVKVGNVPGQAKWKLFKKTGPLSVVRESEVIKVPSASDVDVTNFVYTHFLFAPGTSAAKRHAIKQSVRKTLTSKKAVR